MRASESERASEREREVGGHGESGGLRGPYAVQALHRRRGGLPARALLRRRARARVLLSLRQRERKRRAWWVPSKTEMRADGCGFACTLSPFGGRGAAAGDAPRSDFFLGAIYQPLLSQASDRALGRQRRHNFWPEGGEVRKFGLAIMAADRLLY